MLIQLPGSVLSRALRSRLIRQRLVNTTTHRFGRGVTSNALRLYSTAKPAAHRTRPNHGHETSPRPTPPVHDVDTSGQREGVRGSSDKYKEERTFLMAIASNLSPHVDADVPRESPGFATNSRRAIMKELEWLKDPRALADRVGRLLQSGDPVMAVALVRQAQKKGDRLEVAWNNILQYCMDRQFHHVAFKFYNDVSLGLAFKNLYYAVVGHLMSKICMADDSCFDR